MLIVLLAHAAGVYLYIGGTISDPRASEFTVIGISQTFSQFLGTSTVTLHLSELQEATGRPRPTAHRSSPSR